MTSSWTKVRTSEAGGGSNGPECPTGTADCDDDPLTCEADVTVLTQCGECNVACSQANGTTICGATGCEVTSCTTGYGDCNATGTDGCETPLNTADNCGFCGRDCGTQACNAQTLCDATVVGSGGDNCRELLHAADESMYAVKRTGKGQIQIAGHAHSEWAVAA